MPSSDNKPMLATAERLRELSPSHEADPIAQRVQAAATLVATVGEAFPFGEEADELMEAIVRILDRMDVGGKADVV